MAKNKKGSSFERDICRDLSLWWTAGRNKNVFWRTSQSGGRATTHAKNGAFLKNSFGDIGYIDDVGKPFIDSFLLELKRGYPNINALDFVDNESKKKILLKEWWYKAECEREKAEKLKSAIIFKKDRKDTCLILETEMVGDIETWCDIYPHNMIILDYNDDRFEDNWIRLSVIKLTDFFNWCSSDNVLSWIKHKECKNDI